MKKRTNVKFMALSALFGALLCLCSWISIPAGAVSFTLQDENATLNDKQIDKIMQKLITNLQNKLDAKLR